jgi:hypothetical protein
MKTLEREPSPSWRENLFRFGFLLKRFSARYGPAIATLMLAAIIGWTIANGVSNYTHGGWELHIERRFNQTIEVNIHFHHWYYGIPLLLLAFALIEFKTLASTFAFGLGQALSAHSFINEGGIPSIIEGGATWRVPPEIYFPIVTALSILFAFFLIRREEWLQRAKEREEITASYLGKRAETDTTLAQVDVWARGHFTRKKIHRDADTQILYGEWSALDREHRGEWQMHYTVMPFDPQTSLWVFRIEHIPLVGRVGLVDDWIQELDQVVKAMLQPVILRDVAAPQESPAVVA